MGTFSTSFADDVALVTGASGGMGRAIALAFARCGARLVLADVDDAGGAETLAQVRRTGATAEFVVTDVADPDAVQVAVTTATRRFGRLDCAVNAAAIENEQVPLHECTLENFERMQAVNLRGCFLSMKEEIAVMLAQEPRGEHRGAIVNIASTNSFRPQHHQPAYTASKHGVLGLTRSAALDYAARGIRINAICPGSIDTPMLRAALTRRGRDPQEAAQRLSLLNRFGTPEEIAAATLWLCSEASSFTVGHALAVDAGYLSR